MKIFILVLSIFIAAFFQATFLNHFMLFNVKPDLLLVCVVVISTLLPFKWALGLSVFAGILKDTFIVQGFGVNTALFALWSWLIFETEKKISLENEIVPLVLIAIISFLHNLLTGLIMIYLGKPVTIGHYTRILFIATFYTTLIFPLVQKLLRKFSLFKWQIF
ncbi:MAG: rod shape-determining protein MreD [Candidatus Omnitrophica bacterium]|nr:rod shape-determining protein MreD [Candidatus Omnitrophota bacterium]